MESESVSEWWTDHGDYDCILNGAGIGAFEMHLKEGLEKLEFHCFRKVVYLSARRVAGRSWRSWRGSRRSRCRSPSGRMRRRCKDLSRNTGRKGKSWRGNVRKAWLVSKSRTKHRWRWWWQSTWSRRRGRQGRLRSSRLRWKSPTTSQLFLSARSVSLSYAVLGLAIIVLMTQVCLEEMAPPTRIFQCRNGHLLCETCKYVNVSRLAVSKQMHPWKSPWFTFAIFSSNPNVRNCPRCRQEMIGRATDTEDILRFSSSFHICV